MTTEVQSRSEYSYEASHNWSLYYKQGDQKLIILQGNSGHGKKIKKPYQGPGLDVSRN